MATTAIVNPNGDGTGFNVEVRGSDGTIYVGTLAAQERRRRVFEREVDDLGEGMDDSSNMNDDNYLDDSSLRVNYAVADPVALKGLENSYKSSSIGSDSRYNSSSNFFSNPSTNQSLDADTEMMEAMSNKGGRKRRTKGKFRRTKRGGISKGKRTKRRRY